MRVMDIPGSSVAMRLRPGFLARDSVASLTTQPSRIQNPAVGADVHFQQALWAQSLPSSFSAGEKEGGANGNSPNRGLTYREMGTQKATRPSSAYTFSVTTQTSDNQQFSPLHPKNDTDGDINEGEMTKETPSPKTLSERHKPVLSGIQAQEEVVLAQGVNLLEPTPSTSDCPDVDPIHVDNHQEDLQLHQPDHPSRIQAILQFTADRGYSQEVADLVASTSIRKSSGNIYDSKWNIFCRWCTARQKNPLNLPLGLLADFFLHLFKKGRSTSTITGFRAAINSVWTLNGRNITADEVTSRLFSAFRLERPRSLIRVPRWDLLVVLRHLKRDKFSPANMDWDPNPYAAMTAFLLLLASARRCSDIHAIHPRKILWKDDGAVILTPFPGYLPKIMSTAEGNVRYSPIEIKPLGSHARNTSDARLCPVKALRTYHDWANSVAPDRDRFWISARGKHNPVVKSTLASWVRNLIKEAHQDAAAPGEEAQTNARVHELRGIAASLSLQATFSMESILEAASWASSSTTSTLKTPRGSRTT